MIHFQEAANNMYKIRPVKDVHNSYARITELIPRYGRTSPSIEEDGVYGVDFGL